MHCMLAEEHLRTWENY